jgi:ABC-type glycerol-3-phosphate transport system substrate-binding protein
MAALGPWNRRQFLEVSGLAAATAALAGCASEPGTSGPSKAPAGESGGAPKETFEEPSTKISGTLSILLWSHFVPSADTWFDKFAKDWGKKVGVDVKVDHIALADVPAQIASEIQAGQGHDMMQYIATLSQFEPGVLDMKDVTDECNKRFGQQLEICKESSFNPNTGTYYAFAPGWVPDPGNYRKSLWEPVGMADGPSTWDDLLKGTTEIKKSKGIQVGLGMSQELDSNMATHALMWSFGGSVQDANEKVILNSPEVIAAVEYMTKLYQQAMTPEVFSWNAASNNQGLIAGKLSYILNSLSAWRTAQEVNPDVSKDVFFTKALKGPKAALAAQHVLYNWILPKHSGNVDAAKEFLFHYTSNFASASYASKMYDFPAWPKLSPDLPAWLKKDPFGATPADKLSFLGSTQDAAKWSASIGHPGPSSPAIGEVLGTYLIPNMFAKAARGELTPEQTVAQTQTQVEAVFTKWRARGLVGG